MFSRSPNVGVMQVVKAKKPSLGEEPSTRGTNGGSSKRRKSMANKSSKSDGFSMPTIKNKKIGRSSSGAVGTDSRRDSHRESRY